MLKKLNTPSYIKTGFKLVDRDLVIALKPTLFSHQRITMTFVDRSHYSSFMSRAWYDNQNS